MEDSIRIELPSRSSMQLLDTYKPNYDDTNSKKSKKMTIKCQELTYPELPSIMHSNTERSTKSESPNFEAFIKPVALCASYCVVVLMLFSLLTTYIIIQCNVKRCFYGYE